MGFQKTKDLVRETIAFPVNYDNSQQIIRDSKGMMICDIKGWGRIQFMEKSEERQDAIGEKIAKLLNNYNAEPES
ncbi:MAG TPA: hypothetical protein VLN72_00175 [Gillisia sp.]|nr:hypothetical protein [Gillisia sp.]